MTVDKDDFEYVLEREFRWPRPGDSPFKQSPDSRNNAYINRHGQGRLYHMMAGYKMAADLLVQHAQTEVRDRDSLVFPIIFTYRQFVELSLKYLIATYGPTVGIEANWSSHDLSVLWRRLSDVLTGYGHDDMEEADPVVAGIVAEFSKVDPKSFSYRYPVDRNGGRIPIAHEELDLAILADVMDALDGYFTGCDGYLDHLQGAGP